MVLLKDFEKLDRYLDVKNMKQYFDTSFSLKFNGWFYEFEKGFSLFYLKEDILYFSYNETNIVINSDIVIKISKPLLIDSSLPLKLYQKYFKLYEKKELLISFAYIVEEFYQITMEEKEDFDWGLFISNYINIPKKRKQIIELLKSNSPIC